MTHCSLGDLSRYRKEGDLSRYRKELYRGFRFGSSGGTARLVGGGDSFLVELGARLGRLEQLRVLAHLAACSERVGPQRRGLQNVPGRNA